ncbi:iron dicitrate transport regulator FecR, partial [Pseudomonas sp. K5002]|nr:iron dicitrate transport regulator FecR [Pseudomonas sp. K5002]
LPATLLGADQRATFSYAKGTLQQQTLTAGEVADWRGGHVSFRNRELASLMDELSLYRPQAPLLVDSAVAQLKVSGNLDVNDPDALLNALPALLPVKTVALADGNIRIEPRK